MIRLKARFQVRSNIDDVHSVTSGETTASDSGRGVSEDDAMLAAISELQVDSGGKHGDIRTNDYAMLIFLVNVVHYIRQT